MSEHLSEIEFALILDKISHNRKAKFSGDKNEEHILSCAECFQTLWEVYETLDYLIDSKEEHASLIIKPFMANTFEVMKQMGLIFTQQLQMATTVRSTKNNGLTKFKATILHQKIPEQHFTIDITASAESLDILWSCKKEINFTTNMQMKIGSEYSENQTFSNNVAAHFILSKADIENAADVSFSVKEKDIRIQLLEIKIDAYKPNSVSD